jgi:hypothetical protein
LIAHITGVEDVAARGCIGGRDEGSVNGVEAAKEGVEKVSTQ